MLSADKRQIQPVTVLKQLHNTINKAYIIIFPIISFNLLKLSLPVLMCSMC